MTTDWKYGILHWIEHFLLAFLLAYLLTSGLGIQISAPSSLRFAGVEYQLDLWAYFLVFFFTVVIDLDHLKVIAKHGLSYITDFAKGGKYPFHRLHFLVLFLLLLPIFFYFKLSLPLIIFAAIALHLLWDLIEDLLIFRSGIKYWL